MPLYDYRCHKCGETFEVIQKFSDELLKTHEGCGGEVERLVSVPAIQFKGTGWYVTDYGKGGKSPSTSTDSKTEKKSETKSDTPAETKTETKAESKPAATTTPSDK